MTEIVLCFKEFETELLSFRTERSDLNFENQRSFQEIVEIYINSTNWKNAAIEINHLLDF